MVLSLFPGRSQPRRAVCDRRRSVRDAGYHQFRRTRHRSVACPTGATRDRPRQGPRLQKEPSHRNPDPPQPSGRGRGASAIAHKVLEEAQGSLHAGAVRGATTAGSKASRRQATRRRISAASTPLSARPSCCSRAAAAATAAGPVRDPAAPGRRAAPAAAAAGVPAARATEGARSFATSTENAATLSIRGAS